MNTRPPKLSWHKHARQWFVKWGGKFHWLGKDKRSARRQYIEQLDAWREWRDKRDAEFEIHPPSRARRLTIGELCIRFLDARIADGRAEHTILHLKHALRRFANVYAAYPAREFRPQDLAAYKLWLIRLMPEAAPRTVNHQLDAARNLLNWAGETGLVGLNNYRGIKPLRVPPPEPRGYTLAQARRMFALAPAWLKPWIGLTWHTLCRPTETVRLVHRLGDWCDADGRKAADQQKARTKYGLFRLLHGHSKTEIRYVVFSATALKMLDSCEPRFHRRDSFSRACARHCDTMTPHYLRHGGATILNQKQKVGRELVDQILGHYPRRVSRTYQPIDWRALRRSVGRIPQLQRG